MFKKLMVLSLILIIPMFVWGATAGKIQGVIKDKSTSEPLPGVNVVLEGTEMGAATDIDGYYVILNVPVGTYSIRISYIGYKDVVVQDVRVSGDFTTEINYDLDPTAIELEEAVLVTAERPMIRKDETNRVEIRTAEEIKVLPIRNLNSLASIAAGTVNDEGTVYMRGGRANETAYIIDGVVQNELFFGGNRTNINTNSIEELQVQTGGFNAEYGSIMSGLVIVTTQAGSQDYHFTAEAITDEFLPRDSKTLGTYSYGYNDYNFSLSGPLVPGFNKLTFFGSIQRFARVDRDPRLNWADGKTYTVADPFIVSVDTIGGTKNITRDTVDVTLDENIKPGNWQNELNFNGKLRWRVSNNFDLQLSGIVSNIDNQNTNLGSFGAGADAGFYRARESHMLVNSAHSPRTELRTQSFNLTFTHTLNPTTFYDLRVGYYKTFRERGDGLFFDDLFAYGDPAKNHFLPLEQNESEPNFGEPITGIPLNNTIAGAWHGQGYLYNAYSKQEQEMISVNLNLTRQQGKNHLLKFGGEYRYNTMRWYSLGAYPGVVGLAEKLSKYEDAIAAGEYTEEYAWYDLYHTGARADYFGYDFRGNEVDEGDWFLQDPSDPQSIEEGRPDGPKHPIVAAAYIQDKVEFNDLILNLGLRFDYLNPNDWQLVDINSPFDHGQPAPLKDIFDEGDIEDSDVHTFLSPRLGFAYPVSENTVFHAQYGKFYQMPRLIDLYTSKNYLDIMLLDHPYYDNVGFPNLKPERTTSYEIGFKQRLSSIAALNITAFYKETSDLVREENFSTDIQDIGFMANTDFGTVKGLEFALNLRRFHNFSAAVNYTLSYAVGTGSNSNTLRDITWLQGDYPKATNPLDFDQRHTGSISVDYRLGKGQGPVFSNIRPFENFGLNMFFNFNSGRPYTKLRVISEPFWGGATGNRPLSAINANYSPYNWYVDLKVDRTFNLPMFDTRLNVYVWVLNLFETENVVNVYPFTGDADSNGWLESPDGQQWQAGATADEVELYKKREKNPFNYGPPRQIRLGVRLEL
jgi:outer membrane receptor protein involved in Fe transport